MYLGTVITLLWGSNTIIYIITVAAKRMGAAGSRQIEATKRAALTT